MDVMGEEEVIDEVLEIERSMQMELENEKNNAANIQLMEDVEVIHHGVLPQDHQVLFVGNDQYPILNNHDNHQLQDIGIEDNTSGQMNESNMEHPPNDGDNNNSSDDEVGENGIDSEGNPKSVTIVVQLTDEGAITLDEDGVVPAGAEPHVYFPITLPATKVKSVQNPLLGAKDFQTGQRARKTKPQAILYNDEIDQVYEMLPDRTGISIQPPQSQSSEVEDDEDEPEVIEVSDEDDDQAAVPFSIPEHFLGQGPDPTTLAELASTLLPADINIEMVENFFQSNFQQSEVWKEADKLFAKTKYNPPPEMPKEEPHEDHSYCSMHLASNSASATAQVQVSPEVTTVVEKTTPTVENTVVEMISTGPTPKRPYPTRQNRKLPAHLADPNYINLDESKRKFQDEPSILNTSLSKKKKTEEDDEDELSIVENDDDPNKLWCICRKPHNNRFMICCDICEEWFHGKCVGVTKANSSKFDKWVCPDCKKKKAEKEKSPAKVYQRKSRGSTGSTKDDNVTPNSSSTETKLTRNHSTTTPEVKDSPAKSSKVKEEKSDKEKETNKPTFTQSEISIIRQSFRKKFKTIFETRWKELTETELAEVPKENTPKSLSLDIETESFNSFSGITLKYKNKCRSIILNLSDSKNNLFKMIAMNKLKPKDLVKLESLDKNKKVEKMKLDSKHRHSTRSKESVDSSSNDARSSTSEKAKGTTEDKKETAAESGDSKKTSTISSSSPRKQSSQQHSHSSKSDKSSLKSSNETSKPSSEKQTGSKDDNIRRNSSTEPKLTRTHSTTPEVKDSPTKSSKLKKIKSIKEKETDKPTMLTQSEISTIRQSFREKLKTIFETRLKELTEIELAEIPKENTPDSLSLDIETESFNSFSGITQKYKNKCRSIIFNLNDSRNNLFKTIAMNELKSKDLVKLESHQLASDELAQWRLNESKKELEMIKRAEIAKFEELKKQEKIDHELGFEQISKVIVENEVRSLGETFKVDDKVETGIVIDPTHSKTITRSSSRHKSSHHSKSDKSSSSSKSSHDKNKKDEKKKSDSKHRHSTRSKESVDSTSNEARSSTSEKAKATDEEDKEGTSIAVESSDSKKTSTRSSSRHKSSSQHSHSSKTDKSSSSKSNSEKSKSSTENKSRKEEKKSDSKSAEQQRSTRSKETSAETTPTDAELPSSTIKTPDFTPDETGVGNLDKDTPEEQKPILKSRFNMPELGSFNASLFNVSHHSLSGPFFPTSPVPIVGRIIPSTVWDYIDKMKKSKEVIVLRLAPSTPADAEGYMSFFTYFSSRSRLAVLGGIASPIKDVYLVPLEKHTPINKALLPLNGPGLPKNRSHCLLAIITRHSSELAVVKNKRRNSPMDINSPKRMKLSTEIKPGLISSLNLISPMRASSITSSPAAETPKKSPEESQSSEDQPPPVNDDDLPYTPWEEDEDEEEDLGNNPGAGVAVLPTSSSPIPNPFLKDLQELEAKIQEEQQAIESMTMQMIANQDSIIPGLDGEFGGVEPEAD